MTGPTPAWGSTGRGTPPQSSPDPRAAEIDARRRDLAKQLTSEGHTIESAAAIIRILLAKEFPNA